MKGAVSHSNPVLSGILVVGFTCLAFVGYAITDRTGGGLDLVQQPLHLTTGLLIALLVGGLAASVDFLGSIREPEILDEGDRWRIRLGWRTMVERHALVGGIVAVITLLAWWMSFPNPVWVWASAVQALLWMVGLGSVAWALSKRRERLSELVITDEAMEVDGLHIPRSAIVSVEREGILGRHTRIVRSDGPSIRLDMRGNRPATRSTLIEALRSDPQHRLSRAAQGQRLGRKHGGGHWVTAAGWAIGFPLMLIASGFSVGWLESITQLFPKGTLPWVLLTLFFSALFAIPLSVRQKLQVRAERPDGLSWRPAAEGMMVRSLTQAWMAWMAAWLGCHMMLGLDNPSLFAGAVGTLLGLGLLGAQLGRRRFSDLELDVAGVVLSGRHRVRVPWSELVGATYRGGLFPALILEQAGGRSYALAVGGADPDEVDGVLVELRSHLGRVEPATESERRKAARAAKLGRQFEG